MAEEPTAEDTTTTDEGAADASEPTEHHCRHCGKKTDIDTGANPDWQCRFCGRFQNTVACPMCHQPVSVDVLPADAVPAAAKPRR